VRRPEGCAGLSCADGAVGAPLDDIERKTDDPPR
jgi:hypothetical protein